MLLEEIKKYDEELEKARDSARHALSERDKAYLERDAFRRMFDHIHPVKIYKTDSRGNTTIMFEDGSCETVKRKKGEKDCLDTAIAYALMKHVYPKHILKHLKDNIEIIKK